MTAAKAEVEIEDSHYTVEVEINGGAVDIDVPVCQKMEIELDDYFDVDDCVQTFGEAELLEGMDFSLVTAYVAERMGEAEMKLLLEAVESK